MDILAYSAVELSAAIKAGKVTAVEAIVKRTRVPRPLTSVP